MGTTPNNAEFYDGIVKANPVILYGANGQVISTVSGMPVQITNVTPLGQNVMANSSPVVLPSDQSAIPVKQSMVEVLSGNTGTGGLNTVTGTNTDLYAWIDVSAYKSFSLHVLGTWSMTLTIQCSDDGATPITVDTWSPNQQGSNFTTVTANGMYCAPLGYHYLRVRCTGGFVSNSSLSAVLDLFTVASPQYLGNGQIFLGNAGGIIGAIGANASGGTSDFHLVSAASNNATSIKGSAGQVYGYEIYNNNAAARYVKLYNKATTPAPATDAVFRTIGIAPNSRASFHSSTGLAMGTGIALATVTGISDTDNTSVGASDLVIDIDWK